MPDIVRIINRSCPEAPALSARYCASFFCRLRGLTFTHGLPPGRGLLLVQSRDSRIDSSIHMLFVFADLAAVWINTAHEVVDVQLARAWRLAYWPQKPARYVLETNPAHLGDFKIGDRLDFEEAPLV